MSRILNCLLGMLGLAGLCSLTRDVVQRLPEVPSPPPLLDHVESYSLYYLFAFILAGGLLRPVCVLLPVLLRDLKLSLQWLIYVGASVESCYFNPDDVG